LDSKCSKIIVYFQAEKCTIACGKASWRMAMSDQINWDEAYKQWMSQERNPKWPHGVRTISIGGLSFLGVHEKTGQLYWDGREIVTANVFSLGTFERWLAGLAAAGTFGVFIVEFGRTFLGWK